MTERVIHPPFDGQHLAAIKAPPLPWPARVLIASLAAALIFSVFVLTFRALVMSEQLAQLARV